MAELRAPLENVDGPDPREDALRRCLGQLPEENRDLILRYYQGEGGGQIARRKELGERFGLPATALRMRALRLREKLLACVERRLRGGNGA